MPAYIYLQTLCTLSKENIMQNKYELQRVLAKITLCADRRTDRLHSKLVSKHHFVNKLLISFENDAVVVVGRRSGALLFTQIVGH